MRALFVIRSDALFPTRFISTHVPFSLFCSVIFKHFSTTAWEMKNTQRNEINRYDNVINVLIKRPITTCATSPSRMLMNDQRKPKLNVFCLKLFKIFITSLPKAQHKTFPPLYTTKPIKFPSHRNMILPSKKTSQKTTTS